MLKFENKSRVYPCYSGVRQTTAENSRARPLASASTT